MNAVDTCVLVRWVLRDDPVQTATADAILAEPFYLGVSVIVELNWVLRTIGEMSRNQISKALASLLGLPSAYVQHENHVRWAVERFVTQGDLADLIHICNSGEAEHFATFDKRLINQAGSNSPVPVKVLT